MNFTGPGRPYPFLLPGPPPHHPILVELIVWGGAQLFGGRDPL